MKISEAVGKVVNGAATVANSMAKDIDTAMTRVLFHKNCTEEGDLTLKDIRALQDSKPSAEFTKVIKKMLPGMPRLVEENICTDRVDGRKSYEDRTIVLAPALLGALGYPAVSSLAYLNTAQGISNVSCFCEQEGMTELPHYQTVTDALDSITDMEGFNNVYAGLFDKIDRSHRYDTTRPTVVYQGKRGEDGEFPLLVARATPLIGDAVETAREQHRMSDQDLTFVFRDKDGNITRTDYAHKVMYMTADMGDILAPFCAEPIENQPGIDFVALYGEKDTEQRKQACEIRVATDMVKATAKRYPGKVFMPQGDGLYPTRPFMSIILENNWPFIFTLKEGCAPALYRAAMDEMDRQSKEYAEGRLGENPVHSTKVDGTLMQVQCAMDVTALMDNPEWAPYPANVIMATYRDTLTICNERVEHKIRTRKDVAKVKAENEASPLPDFTVEECKQMFRERYKQYHPKMKAEQIEEILEGVTFIQFRDKRTLCRIVTAQINQRFVWVTNIVPDLEGNKDAKELLMGKLLGENGSEDYGKMLDAKKYVAGYLGRIVYQARRRWCVEEVFQMVKGDLFKVGRKKRHKSYKVEKALFYITLLSWFFLELYRTYSKYAAKGLKRWKVIAECLRASFRSDDVRDEAEYMNRRTCYRPQLE